ncbi:MAG TPA: SGNH/GDSL hydrolase family protein, partial [Planctomycetaceae bacterium]|nr:SGNH/GDSL hydrolase family protein [Planctomycetaceae bacterium]
MSVRFFSGRFIVALCGCGILMCGTAVAETGLKLQPHDRIVFLGDSITQAGAAPGGYVTLVKEALATRHKNLEIEVIGAGISGNRVPDLERRLEKDVLAKKPTLVVIYIGINDVWHSQKGRGTPKADFDAGLRRIVEKIQSAGARVVLCTPSVIGERHDGANPLDPMLDEYSDISRKVAADTKSQLLDLRQQFLGHLKKSNSKNAEKDLLTTDGVHLNAAGNRFVADRVLEALGAI